MTFKILIGGYDGAGKSTLACSLYVYLCMTGHDVGLHEIDPWSDTHAPLLGRKSWAARDKRKGFVEADIYRSYVEPFAQDTRDIVIGDVQGNYQCPHNAMWADLADVAILVSRRPTEKDIWRAENESRDTPGPQTVHGWRTLFAANGIKRIFYIESLLDGQRPPSLAADKHFAILGLDRALVPLHPDIKNLAELLLRLMPQS